MAYRDDIAALGADHHWDFDGDSLDQIGAVNGTDTGVIFTDLAISEDAVNCVTTDTIAGDRVTLATTVEINNSAQARKAVSGWFMITEFSPHPVRIYGEGTNATVFQFICGYGNNSLFECVEPTNFPTGLQVFGIALVPNRAYHLCGIFLGNAQGNEVKFFIDGVEQLAADPLNRQPATASLDARGVPEFGDPAGTVGIGGDVVIQQAATNAKYNHWVTWGDEVAADLTDIEVRGELFEKGALANEAVTSGTQSVMQTNLETIDNALKGNHPVCIRVPANTGDTSFELTAIGITFDPLASVHIQYMGTATLTWKNDRNSAATIFSTPNGGTVVVQNETQLDISGLQNPTEIRVFEAGSVIEIAGSENVTTGLFQSFVFADSVDIMIVSLTEDIIRLTSVDTSTNVVLQVSQFFDRNYTNPV